MVAEIKFYAGEDFTINDLAGSGLGFYGDSGFGASVPVGEWQGRTFITNAGGTAMGPEVDNVKYLNDYSGILGQDGSGITLRSIPNYLATLNIRFTYDSAIQVQNAQVRIYDKVDADNPASGVTTMGAEIIHVDEEQTANGSGSQTWVELGGSGSILDMAQSPGISGLYAADGTTSVHTDTRHDWYLALSASPDSIGSKPYGLFFSLEFL